MDENVLNNVAKTLNVDAGIVRARAEEILTQQGDAWIAAGKSESDCGILALRVAARMINTDNARLKRAGVTTFEGMFVDMPRPKMWGEWGYKKMKTQLLAASPDARQALIDSGAVVLYDDNHDGTFIRYAREDFGGNEAEFSELPKHTMRLDENTHFYPVWDKSNATFPSGDANFKFGRPRPQDDRERVSLFYGRPQGSTDDVALIEVRAQGKAADIQHSTFTTGTIPLRAGAKGKNGLGRAYAKPEVSILTEDDSLSSLFPAPPIQSDNDGGFSGLIPTLSETFDWLPNLMALEGYFNENHGKEGWFDRKVALVTEVIHIDPRENGGFILVCSDLDITSTAATLDVYVSAQEEISFGVGTKLMVIGQTWRSQEGEQRLTVNGWFPFDSTAGVEVVGTNIYGEAITTQGDEDSGWDE